MKTVQARFDSRYFLAILIPWSLLWGSWIWISVADPISLCGDPNAMCCVACGLVEFVFVFYFGYPLLAILFAPGFLLARFMARKVSSWKKVYWVFAWIGVAATAGVPIAIYLLVKERDLVTLNPQMIWDYPLVIVSFGFFGLVSGVSYWLLPGPSGNTK